MSDVTVIDNFLDPKSFEDIQETMMSREFPWYWGDSVVYTKQVPDDRLYSVMKFMIFSLLTCFFNLMR